MLFSLVVLVLVPLTFARSAVKPDHHAASRFDRSSGSPFANLLMGLDAPFFKMFEEAGPQENRHKLRSIGADTCYCRCLDDQSSGNTGCLCACEDQDVPITRSNCLRACEPLKDSNFCIRVCPSEEETYTHTSRDVPIFKLGNDAVPQGSDYKMLSANKPDCKGNYLEDEITGNIGYMLTCTGEIPTSVPGCLLACEPSGVESFCLIVCRSEPMSINHKLFDNSIHKRA